MLSEITRADKILLMDRFVNFKTTIWTVIQQAKKAQTTALNDFVTKYRSPVKNFIIKQGFTPDRAEDLTQDVFLRLFRDKVLEKADQSKGRFRSLLLVVTKHVVKDSLRLSSMQKRSPPEAIVSIEDMEKELMVKDDKEEEFDKEWIRNLASSALEKLKDQNKNYYDVMSMYLSGMTDVKDIAFQLKKTPREITIYLYRGKLKLAEYIHDEIASYSSSKEEYKEEVDYLSKYLE